MPKNLNFQRLNKKPKHRFSMLRNMVASLFLHERIKTTQAKAKSLVPFANRLFFKSLNKNISNGIKAHDLIRVRAANYKLFTHLKYKYATYSGSIIKMTNLSSRRRGDNSKEAMVELVNKYLTH
jgi:large subunit ribosomal protein L17